MRDPRDRGSRAEAHALNYLVDRGMKMVARNFHSHRGEIDLVMLDGGCLVFIEVRSRQNTGFGSAAESVTRKKQLRIVRAAHYFLQTRAQWAVYPCRFDVIAIDGRPDGTIDWIKDAFQPG